MVRIGRQHANRPRLNNMNGARPIGNLERRNGNDGELPNIFRQRENDEELPQLSQESNEPIVEREYLRDGLVNDNGEQQENIDENHNGQGLNPIFQGLRNFRGNRVRPHPPVQDMPQPLDNSRVEPHHLVNYENNEYKIILPIQENEDECVICISSLYDNVEEEMHITHSS